MKTMVKVDHVHVLNVFYRPYAGCLQFLTEAQGRFTTFNFDAQQSTHLADQSYNICIRKLPGTLISKLSKKVFEKIHFRILLHYI